LLGNQGARQKNASHQQNSNHHKRGVEGDLKLRFQQYITERISRKIPGKRRGWGLLLYVCNLLVVRDQGVRGSS
jgi:hypothetical protein